MLRNLALTVLLLALVPAALAQDEPSFFVESIEVRNNDRVSADVIVAESRLRAGRAYSEQELREASDRVNRLRFLLSADLALEKGSDRGKHRVVISVNETRVFFFAIDGRYFFQDEPHASYDDTEELNEGTGDVALGWRFFLGRRGAVHFGIVGSNDNFAYTPEYTSFAVGYTQYDLFGTRAFATLNLKRPIQEGASSSISPELVVGIPLSTTQTLTLDYDSLDVRHDGNYYVVTNPDAPVRGELRPYERRNSYDLFRATWSHNTTNSPFFPTRGVRLALSGNTVSADRTFLRWERRPDGTYSPAPAGEDIRTHALEASARRYWELSDRNSVSLGLQGGTARHDIDATDRGRFDVNETYGRVIGGFTRSLRDAATTARTGESLLQLETRLRVSGEDRDDFDALYDDDPTRGSGNASVSWVRRNAWGTWRLGLGYAW